MNINENVKNAIKQHQDIFEASYKTALLAIDQVEQITTNALEQAQVPKDSIELFKNAFNECNKTRDILKKNIDDNYKSLQVFF